MSYFPQTENERREMQHTSPDSFHISDFMGSYMQMSTASLFANVCRSQIAETSESDRAAASFSFTVWKYKQNNILKICGVKQRLCTV